MFENFAQWVESILGAEYQYSRGAWTETPNLQSICAIYGTGGPATDVEDRRPRYRVLLVGPRNQRQAAIQLQADIESLMQSALNGDKPCGAASLRAIGEPSGPGYTTENRAWLSVDFQLTY